MLSEKLTELPEEESKKEDKRRAAKTQIQSIAAWVPGFARYMGVMAVKHPERTPNLAAYMAQINQASRQFKGTPWQSAPSPPPASNHPHVYEGEGLDYEAQDQLISKLEPGAQLTKLDIKQAYRNVPVQPPGSMADRHAIAGPVLCGHCPSMWLTVCPQDVLCYLGGSGVGRASAGCALPGEVYRRFPGRQTTRFAHLPGQCDRDPCMRCVRSSGFLLRSISGKSGQGNLISGTC